MQVKQPNHSGVGGAKASNGKEWRNKPDPTATQSAEAGSSGLGRLHTKAKQNRSLRFNNLLHHITPALLVKAYNRLNRKPTRGVDGESWTSYGKHLPERIEVLHKRIHTQGYKPKLVLRIWRPKLNGSRRPIGITSVEDNRYSKTVVGTPHDCMDAGDRAMQEQLPRGSYFTTFGEYLSPLCFRFMGKPMA